MNNRHRRRAWTPLGNQEYHSRRGRTLNDVMTERDVQIVLRSISTRALNASRGIYCRISRRPVTAQSKRSSVSVRSQQRYQPPKLVTSSTQTDVPESIFIKPVPPPSPPVSKSPSEFFTPRRPRPPESLAEFIEAKRRHCFRDWDLLQQRNLRNYNARPPTPPHRIIL